MEWYFWQVWHFLSHRWTRYVAAWLACLGATGILHYEAWHGYDDRREAAEVRTDGDATPDPATTGKDLRRADGTAGHVAIDFSGQWMMGRMLVRGYGRKLYSRSHQYEVMGDAYPRSDESPTDTARDR